MIRKKEIRSRQISHHHNEVICCSSRWCLPASRAEVAHVRAIDVAVVHSFDGVVVAELLVDDHVDSPDCRQGVHGHFRVLDSDHVELAVGHVRLHALLSVVVEEAVQTSAVDEDA